MKPIQWFSEEITDVVKPVIRDFFIDVYEKPDTYLDPDVKEAGNQLIKFQLALKKIPNWTTTQIKKQIDEIKHRCPGFKQLLVALFVTYINKISKDIRTSSKARRLDVKLPSDETFVHTCFVNCAHNLYEDPYVMKKSEYERASDLDRRLEKCISVAIRKLIPTLDIINNYIPALGDEMCFNSDQPQQFSTEPEPEPEPVTSTENPISTEGDDEGSEGEKEERAEELKGGEPKTIETSTELFPDAPDKISTKQ
jgi:hypothetical protein